MKHIWTELGKLEHEARARQYNGTDAGWLVTRAGAAAGQLIASMRNLVAKQATESAPRTQTEDPRVTREFRPLLAD